jgi:2-C-methyl-D-erythritol 4-phosphate cytidylyltransferase
MSRQEDCGLVLAAAGLGSRFGSSEPKQFWELNGKPLYLHALEPFQNQVGEAVVVVPQGWDGRILDQIRSLLPDMPVQVHTGGTTRQESVFRGLNRLSSCVEFVLVHDAARPFITASLIERVLNNTRKYGACVPVVPVRDTVKKVENSFVECTIDRQALFLTQTPQGFELKRLQKALEKAEEAGYLATDEASLLEYVGEKVRVVEGEIQNVKVTWSEDLMGQHIYQDVRKS